MNYKNLLLALIIVPFLIVGCGKKDQEPAKENDSAKTEQTKDVTKDKNCDHVKKHCDSTKACCDSLKKCREAECKNICDSLKNAGVECEKTCSHLCDSIMKDHHKECCSKGYKDPEHKCDEHKHEHGRDHGHDHDHDGAK